MKKMKMRKLLLFVCLPVLLLAFSRCHKKPENIKDITPLFSIGTIADVQYADVPAHGKRHYRSALKNLDSAINRLNAHDLSFVVHLGDLIDRDFSSFDDILPVFNKLRHPKYTVLGNHEFAVAPEKKEAVPEKLGMEKRYFSFSKKGWQFIFLDGQDLSIMAHAPQSPKYKTSQLMLDVLKAENADNAKSWNGGLGENQLSWLDKQIAIAASQNNKVMVFCHFPVYPIGADHNLWNDREVVKTLERYKGVKLFMNGHNHAGSDAIHNGIYYLNLKGMVENPEASTYALVHVYEDFIVIDGKGNEPDRVISMTDVANYVPFVGHE